MAKVTDVRVLTGAALEAALDDVAALRIEVFRAFPYLYDGDLAYERDYLQAYRDSADAILVGAFDGEQLIGASTGTPLVDHSDDFGAAFAGTGYDMADIFYCAESVLLSNYRGQGVGHRFFDLREGHAQALGFGLVAFCAVQRPLNHPMRTADYQSLEPFWTKRGYSKLEGAIAEFEWKDLGQKVASAKPLQFWCRHL
ncbi:hypothetical protein TRL7639_00945 [Falsiruegeria litorea R37]|uniref:N-acetyltransferase domain-containing protein n=1 Tax=Falsiruegeria litorea R37 TaxID=1200284 RepID=A0A1Y5RX80_9RHOB|nr:GNAT family N-acetyltransferase [Falsiruegeria litorea]SLN26235.1 hypothetical protein TRL7639_00945 [Falsiruegeria litorea R37]